jgi:hypothetical protein
MEADDHSGRPKQHRMPPNAQMQQIMTGYWTTRAISAVTLLGVPDALGDRARPVTEIAAEVGAHAPTLARVLRSLTEIGVFERQEGGYALTPLGQTLRTGTPGSMASLAVFLGSEWQARVRGGLYDSLRTGRPSTLALLDGGLFGHLDRNPDDAAVFNEAMVEASASSAAAAVAGYDFGRFTTLVDVGGGHGYLLGTVLAAHPELNGVLFDQADVIAGAHVELERLAVVDRCDLVAGSFFDAVPAGADGYLISSVLHDWDDEAALIILRNIAAAMATDALLLIVEWMLTDDTEPDPVGKTLDLQMLISTDGGRERTRDEFERLLGRAGLRLVRVLRHGPVLPALLEVARA